MAGPKFTQAEDIFRDLLKNLRRDRNLTQSDLADRLGLPQSYVSKYETGERRLDFVETFFVCEALGITVEEFARLFASRVGKTGKKRG